MTKQGKTKDAMHARAVELLSSPHLTQSALDELISMKREAHANAQQHTGADADADGGYTPYPDVDDPRFNGILMGKKEFQVHSAEAPRAGADLEELWKAACASEQFELTHSQLFLRNFLSPRTPYRGVLLFHGVGVGKTCSAVTIAEQFDSTRVLVLTRPGLMDGFRKQIFDVSKVKRREDGSLDLEAVTQCTGTLYTDQLRDRALTPEALERGVSRLVSARYSLKGTLTFANEVDALGEGDAALDRIRARYSNMIIIVDEAHHLRGEDSKRAASALRRVLRVVDNTRLVLLTATPMFNDTADLVYLVNLLRINDKRPTVRTRDFFDRDGNLTQAGERRLTDACRGYVSYMRGDNPFSFPVRLTPSVNGDAAVVRPERLPRLDVKGQPIPPEQRIRTLELVCSKMSETQAVAYRAVEQRIALLLEQKQEQEHEQEQEQEQEQDAYADADGEGEGEGEGEGGTPEAAASGSSALQSGLEICNIAYPLPGGGGAAYGRAGFDQCFLPAPGSSGRLLQVRYRPGTPQLLALPALHGYAPKLATVVERILSSTGVVMVYSRWVWSGLVPLALALEHAGFTRADGSRMLVGTDAQVPATAAARRQTYAIISGQRDVASDLTATVRSLRSSENQDGAIIKVVLISDKGSEGLDLRFVREVHVMDPWYHMNKIEQIVGRAARHCTSHSEMPPEQRNVTVFLHAIINGARETMDLRAYRIAELKQARIIRVEAVVRNTAIDCLANRPRLYYDSRELGISIDLVTSQGTSVRGYRLGDRADSALSLPPPKCAGAGTVVKSERVDESTYDTATHAHHLYAYRRILRDLFAEGRYQATYEELWSYVSSKFPRATREMLSASLDEMIYGRLPLLDKAGRRGRLQYRWDEYVFHPDDALLPVLTHEERRKPHPPYRLLSLRAQQQKQQQQQRTAPALEQEAPLKVLPVWTADEIDELLRQRHMALLNSLPPPLVRALSTAAMDAVIDRLAPAELLRLCASLMQSTTTRSSQTAPLTDTERQALRSLERARVILPGGVVRNPHAPPQVTELHCYDPKGGHLRRCEGAESSVFAAAAQDAARLPPPDMIAAMIVPVPGQDRTVLKVHSPGTTIDRGGCVCHQTSSLTTRDLWMLSSAAVGSGDKAGAVSRVLTKQLVEALDKRTLCTLYELLLRRFRPKTLLRPADAQDHLRRVKEDQDLRRTQAAEATKMKQHARRRR